MRKVQLGLALVGFFFALSGAFADAKSFESGVTALATQSQAYRKPCADYRTQLARLDKTGSAVFKNKAIALAVAQRLGRYPGIPAPAGKAYAAAIGALPRGIDWSWFMRTYGSLQGACGVIESYGAINRLINSTRILRFTQAERTRVRATAFSFVTKNASQPSPLVIGLVQLSVFDQLVGARLVKLDPRSASGLKSLMAQGEQLRKHIASLVRVQKNPTDRTRASDLIYELKSAEWLRARFVPLLKVAKPA